jgi:Ca2+-binding RTX toxin-like protein
VTYSLGGNAIAGVDYTYPAGFDPATGIGTATIAAGATSVDVTIPTLDNGNADGIRQIRLTLQPTAGYTLNPLATYDTASLIDNDAPLVPVLSVADVSVVEGDSGSKTVTFFLRLNQATSVPVSFNYAFREGSASLGSDFIVNGASSGSLTFAPTATLITLSATVYGDTTVEVDETFFLDLSAASGLTFAGGGPTLTATATIINDDSPAQVDPNQGVTIISGGNFGGTERNDILIGDDGVNRIEGFGGNDQITGGMGADLLFSGSGADQFIYRSFAESSLAFGVDTTDAEFVNGDRIVLPNRPTALWNVGVISAGSLSDAFRQAQNDKDVLTDGAQTLATGEAVLFTWGSTVRGQRTYLGVADGDPIDVTNDFLVLTPNRQFAIGSLDVQAFFL